MTAAAVELVMETRSVLRSMLSGSKVNPAATLSQLESGGFYDGAIEGCGSASIMLALAEELGRASLGGPTWEGIIRAILAEEVPAREIPVSVDLAAGGPRPWECRPGLSLGEDGTVSGSLLGLASEAPRFIVPTTREGSGAIVWVVAEVSDRKDVEATDRSLALARHRFDRVPGDVVCSGARAEELWRSLGERLPLFAAAELLGLGRAVLDWTVQYVETRMAFGRPVGSQQAVKHRCAEMFAEVEAVAGLVWAASTVLAGADERALHLVRAAKARSSARIPSVISDAILTHGALGFTEELGLGRAWRRAISLAASFGSAAEHRRVVAAEVRAER